MVKTQSRDLLKSIKNKKNNYSRVLSSELRKASERVRTKAKSRFQNRFSGSKYAKVLSAIQSTGISVKQSGDDETTVFLYDIDTLDRLTAETAKATNRLHHLWRILHEGSGPEGARTPKNHKSISEGYEPRPYPLLAIVQTAALIPFYYPGAQAPFADLVTLAGPTDKGNGVRIIRSEGFEGHAWFIKNMDLFREDRDEFEVAVVTTNEKVFG